MSLKHVDIGSALRRLGERRIEEAMREGKFDNLKGAGEPLDLEPMPADENTRLTWWALRILRHNDVTPDEVRWRKSVDGLKDALDRATDAEQVRKLVAAINAIVYKINTLGTNAFSAPIAPALEERECQRLCQRMSRGSAA